jgi:hypothetical protein
VCSKSTASQREVVTPTPRRRAERVDSTIARRAARQHGVVTRAQLLDAGLSPSAIGHRCEAERLHRLHNGVYGVGYVSPSPLARAMAAVLACGAGAVLSHRSAAALWEVAPDWGGPVEVTAAGQHRHVGVLCHRSRALTRRETTLHRGIPVTSVARTVIDLAEVLDDRALTRAVNEAYVRRGLRHGELKRLLAQTRGRRAAARLRAFVDAADAPTRSAFEDAFLEFVGGHGLPLPLVNQRVAGYEVDMLWPAQRVIAELDGHAFHGHRGAFEHDRDKDLDLAAADYVVVRVTWMRLAHEPHREAARLRTVLARRAP